MSGQASHRAHVATKAPRVKGFLRRNVGVLAVLGVVVAFAGPAAQAASGDPVIAGTDTYATAPTYVHSTSIHGLCGYTTDSSQRFAGVYGGNFGGGNGVEGDSVNFNGIYLHTSSSTASGVYGVNANGGFAVAGRASKGGVAVLADTADGTGTALRTTGKLQFQNRSGTATVASGQKSVTVTLAGVTTTSMVMATVQSAGGFFASATPAAGSFTIYLNKAPVSPATVKVAYLVLN